MTQREVKILPSDPTGTPKLNDPSTVRTFTHKSAAHSTARGVRAGLAGGHAGFLSRPSAEKFRKTSEKNRKNCRGTQAGSRAHLGTRLHANTTCTLVRVHLAPHAHSSSPNPTAPPARASLPESNIKCEYQKTLNQKKRGGNRKRKEDKRTRMSGWRAGGAGDAPGP